MTRLEKKIFLYIQRSKLNNLPQKPLYKIRVLQIVVSRNQVLHKAPPPPPPPPLLQTNSAATLIFGGVARENEEKPNNIGW